MNKIELVERITAENPTFNKRQARAIITAALAEIVKAAAAGEDVQLTGFGRFMIRDRRPGDAEPGAAKRLAFQPARSIQQTLNGEGGAQEPASTES